MVDSETLVFGLGVYSENKKCLQFNLSSSENVPKVDYGANLRINFTINLYDNLSWIYTEPLSIKIIIEYKQSPVSSTPTREFPILSFSDWRDCILRLLIPDIVRCIREIFLHCENSTILFGKQYHYHDPWFVQFVNSTYDGWSKEFMALLGEIEPDQAITVAGYLNCHCPCCTKSKDRFAAFHCCTECLKRCNCVTCREERLNLCYPFNEAYSWDSDKSYNASLRGFVPIKSKRCYINHDRDNRRERMVTAQQQWGLDILNYK